MGFEQFQIFKTISNYFYHIVELHARCICVCVELKCYSLAALPDLTVEKTLDLFGSGLLCPCKLFSCVCVCVCLCVCVHTSQFMYNK